MFSAMEESRKYILGLDLGSASLGWALIELDETDAPKFLIRTGVRIFQAGVDGTALEIEQGKDKSKAVERRTARLHRRQLRRRAHRQAKLFQLLQQHCLLPRHETSKPLTPSEERDLILTAFDRKLYLKWSNSSVTADFAQLPLYKLRKIALDHKLELYEIGRVLYHFSQRRGFKSNRKEGRQDSDKELGAVKAGIADLAQQKEDAGARTLGEYFAGLDPHQVGQNVRRRWTARKMYEDEFTAIWKKQATYYPDLLNEDLRREVWHWLFYQRPIAAQSHLVGKCELEGNNQRRAAWATLEAQRFRILQKVNDLKVIYPGDPIARLLTPEERLLVFELLDREGDQTFASLRKQLKLDKRSEFNLERGDEKRLRGNRTNKTMLSVFGERWNNLAAEEQKQVVEEWRASESENSLVRRGMERWGLDEIAARKWAAIKPEEGYCALSRKAIGRLLPLMWNGVSFKEAEKEVYGNRFSGGQALEKLPPLHVHRKINGSAELEKLLAKLRLGAIRNPAVERALTELRKVVNAIIREYGKPYEIRIELARELKKPRKERESATKQNRTRQKERENAKADLLRECGIQNPSRTDIEKALLFHECGGECPYTGKHFTLRQLFQDAQFDVEHIIPLSRYPDDSFQNKTLCWHEENRNVKRNKTPFEAYSMDTARWEEMQIRIKAWKPGNPGKLKRFMLRSEDELGEFTARQLTDTRYASVLACRLLESLYGGRDVTTPTGPRQVIYASSGAVTATLRRTWGLEAILREAAPSNNGQSKGKPRTDHRHHAIDAITIALTSQSTIQMMARLASLESNVEQNIRFFRRISSPWPNFVESIRPHIGQLTVSHRPEHKMSGAMHDETNYSRPYKHNGKLTVNIRKPVSGLSATDIEKIVDPAIQSAVRQRALELNGDLSQCESTQSWPTLPSSSGRCIPIKRVRIRKVMTPTAIASGQRQRHVALGNNHHAVIFAKLDEHGRELRWESVDPVSIYEAMERKRKKLPIIQRAYPEFAEYQFKFSLMNGDILEILDEGVPQLFRVRSIESNGVFFLLSIHDARLIKEIAATGDRWRPSADALRKLNCRKVTIDTLGRVRPAND
jgi:CRISPR-associated endonuclease Csn1